MICGKLTIEQKDIISGRTYVGEVYFNPVQNIDDDWVIFSKEMECDYPEFSFVKTLPLIEFIPKPPPPEEAPQ